MEKATPIQPVSIGRNQDGLRSFLIQSTTTQKALAIENSLATAWHALDFPHGSVNFGKLYNSIAGGGLEQIDSLIGTIYEAGALPELWGDAMEKIAAHVGARGGNLIVSSRSGFRITSSPSVAEITREFDAAGWNTQNSRVSRLLARANHSGFLTDADLHTVEELQSFPMYTEFLRPRGADAGAATVIMGASNDAIVLAFEAFSDHGAASSAVALLNRLRPHLARAAILSGRVQDQQLTNQMITLNVIGAPVALLGGKGKLIAASDRFSTLLDDLVIDSPKRLHLNDPEADNRLAQVLSDANGAGASIAIRNRENIGAAVLHLMPAAWNARDLFSKVAYFALIARPDNTMLPSTDIIAALFDLTPAEARVARGVALGRSAMELAQEMEVGHETIKSHLKKAFAKTSTKRQGELALLVSSFR